MGVGVGIYEGVGEWDACVHVYTMFNHVLTAHANVMYICICILQTHTDKGARMQALVKTHLHANKHTHRHTQTRMQTDVDTATHKKTHRHAVDTLSMSR